MGLIASVTSLLTTTAEAVEDTVGMIGDSAKAGRVYTREWESQAHDNVQINKLERAKELSKKLEKLGEHIPKESLKKSKSGYLELDLDTLLASYDTNNEE